MILLEITASRTTPEQWHGVTYTLVFLWMFVGSIVMFAASLLVGHGVIPSLVSTRDLPARFHNLRSVFFASAAIFLLLAIFSFVSFIMHLQVVYEIFDRRWI